jgi:hypothetical protein
MLENESNDLMLIEALLNQHFHKMTHAGIYSEENVIAPPEFVLLPMLAHDVHEMAVRTNLRRHSILQPTASDALLEMKRTLANQLQLRYLDNATNCPKLIGFIRWIHDIK